MTRAEAIAANIAKRVQRNQERTRAVEDAQPSRIAPQIASTKK
jgi:hypothetical protein